jgi:signal transduction histidine kinase
LLDSVHFLEEKAIVKSYQSYIVTGLAALCLVLSIVSIFLGQSNQTAQTEVQQQQEEINKGVTTQQIGTNILRDMASLAEKNDNLRNLLAKNGYTLTSTATPSSSGASGKPASPDAASKPQSEKSTTPPSLR